MRTALMALAVLLASRAEAKPHLRWSFTTRGGLQYLDGVALVDGRARWQRRLPDRIRHDHLSLNDWQVEAHLANPRSTQRLDPLIEVLILDDAIAIADLGGLLLLDRRDGAVLLDAEMPIGSARDQRIFAKGARVVARGRVRCEGTPRLEGWFADCGERLIFVNGVVAASFARKPYRLIAREPYLINPDDENLVEVGDVSLTLTGQMFEGCFVGDFEIRHR